MSLSPFSLYGGSGTQEEELEREITVAPRMPLKSDLLFVFFIFLSSYFCFLYNLELEFGPKKTLITMLGFSLALKRKKEKYVWLVSLIIT